MSEANGRVPWWGKLAVQWGAPFSLVCVMIYLGYDMATNFVQQLGTTQARMVRAVEQQNKIVEQWIEWQKKDCP